MNPTVEITAACPTNGHRSECPRAFRPLPFLSNPHLQTLLGHWIAPRSFLYPTRIRYIRLPDGDQIALHDNVPPSWKPGQRIAVIVHGLGGCARSPHVLRIANRLLPAGIRVVRMDLRGCGAGERVAQLLYHGGCSEDIRAVMAEVHRWSPTSPLVLMGISLGGNIILKAAGETPEHPIANLEGIVAVAPPIDLVRCAALLASPRNRFYDRYFVRLMLERARRWQRYNPSLLPVRFPRRMTVRLFDEMFTAPLQGFADAMDYYQQASSLPVIPRIPVPGLVLTARDDPFIAVEPFEALKTPSGIEVQIMDRGGHLGFLGWDGAGGIHWGERRVAEWVMNLSR